VEPESPARSPTVSSREIFEREWIGTPRGMEETISAGFSVVFS
jgi:hypothetical protein